MKLTRRTLFTAAGLFVTASTSLAATWNVSGPTDNWSTGAGDTNWDAGVTWTDGNFGAVFGGTNGETITVSTVTTNQLVFNNTGTAYNLSGGTITINAGVAGNKSIDATADATISSAISMNGAQTYSVVAGKTLNLGAINAVAAGTNWGLQGGGSIVVNGSIGSNVANVLFNDTANNGTNVTFTQANTFTGLLRLGDQNKASTLNFSNVNQLGSGTGGTYISIQQGSTLNFTGTGNQSQTNRQIYWNVGDATIGVTDANANLTIGSTAGATRNQNFTKTGAGTLTLDSTATITGGTLTVNGGTLVIQSADSSTGATAVSNGVLTLGVGGTLANTSAITIASNATLNLSGSANNQLVAGVSGSTLTINGTLNTTTNQAHTLANGASGYFSTISMNNGTLAATVSNSSGFGAFFFGGDRTVTATGTNTISGVGVIGINQGNFLTLSPTGVNDSINVTGTIIPVGTASGGITKAGLGTVTLSGANSYGGATTVNAGTLLVNGSTHASSAVTVASGARLGGTGIVNGTVNVSGKIRGGDGSGAAGTLTVGGNVALASGSVVELALGSAGAHSALAFNGTESFQSNQAFTFLDFGATAGTYSGLISGVTTPGSTTGWSITNAGWAGTFTWNSGTNAIDLVVTAVPEPSTYGLIGAGALAGVAFVRRRRRHVGKVA